MELPQIPESATMEYLEKLKEKIHQQLKKTNNKRVQTYLHAFLEEVQKREARLQHGTSDNQQDSPSATAEESQRLIDTAHLSEKENKLLKRRFKELFEEIKKQQPKTSELVNTVSLSDDQHEIVKERMKEMLAAVQKTEDIPESQEGGSETQADFSQEEAQPDTSQETQAEEQENEDLSFSSVCRRIGKGESLQLFDKVELSEREQEMLQAFTEHLSQMRGLKRQQVFDLQHLTARSIRELEQIFKTYHLQGYLRAELNNVYNRLLNLRSRFSILLN